MTVQTAYDALTDTIGAELQSEEPANLLELVGVLERIKLQLLTIDADENEDDDEAEDEAGDDDDEAASEYES